MPEPTVLPAGWPDAYLLEVIAIKKTPLAITWVYRLKDRSTDQTWAMETAR